MRPTDDVNRLLRQPRSWGHMRSHDLLTDVKASKWHSLYQITYVYMFPRHLLRFLKNPQKLPQIHSFHPITQKIVKFKLNPLRLSHGAVLGL